MASAVSLEVIGKSILPMLDKLVDDDIPNIRFNVAKSYAVLIDTLKQLPEQGTVLAADGEHVELRVVGEPFRRPKTEVGAGEVEPADYAGVSCHLAEVSVRR